MSQSPPLTPKYLWTISGPILLEKYMAAPAGTEHSTFSGLRWLRRRATGQH